MIAVAVSSINHCYYCLTAHGAAVRQLSGDPALGEMMVMNFRAAELSPKQTAMLEFAVKLTEEPAKIVEADRAALRKPASPTATSGTSPRPPPSSTCRTGWRRRSTCGRTPNTTPWRGESAPIRLRTIRPAIRPLHRLRPHSRLRRMHTAARRGRMPVRRRSIKGGEHGEVSLCLSWLGQDADRGGRTESGNGRLDRTGIGKLGSAVVDGGNPVGMSKTVLPGGKVENNGGSNPTAGYTIIEAKDIDDAVSKAKGCPILMDGRRSGRDRADHRNDVTRLPRFGKDEPRGFGSSHAQERAAMAAAAPAIVVALTRLAIFMARLLFKQLARLRRPRPPRRDRWRSEPPPSSPSVRPSRRR